MSSNKMVKTITEAATLVGISAGVGWVGRKVLKEPFISDPSSNIMNYAKWVASWQPAFSSETILVKEKVIPDNM